MKIIAAVLAGGLARRLGGAKATVELGGRPLIEHPLSTLAAAGLEVVVVAKPDTPLPPLDVPVWVEPEQPAHPLLGILTALERAGGPVLAVGCDMPFLSAELVAHVASLDAHAAMPNAGGRLHPLLARYTPAVAPALARALDSERPLREAVAALAPRVVEEQELRRFGDPDRLLFNVNSRADLERAERICRES